MVFTGFNNDSNYISSIKAIDINESISFQRGLDPKEALGIGIYAERLNPSYEDLLMYPIETTLIFHRPSTHTPFIVGKVIKNDKSGFEIEIPTFWVETKDQAIESYRNNQSHLNFAIVMDKDEIIWEFFKFDAWFSQTGLKSVQAIEI